MYIIDLIQGSISRPSGWFKPRVVRGTFSKCEIGILQEKLYKYLLEEFDFKRTRWQIIFPGQIAGIIKRVQEAEFGADQYHIRFYMDGVIEAEIEFHNWSRKHWSGYRKQCWNYIGQIVNSAPFTDEEKQTLKDFFQAKEYSSKWVS